MKGTFGQALNWKIFRPIAMGAIACFLVFWLSATAQGQSIDCSSSSHWVAAYNGRQVNHAHVFCGEVNRRGSLVGFHSRPSGRNPSTVGRFTITQSANAQGIYGGEWSSASSPQLTKFSTMFPDRCTREQVLNSIAYAESNRVQCPSGAPNWAWCGLSHPSDGSKRFCAADNGGTFTIAGATNSDGKINTGFPLRR